MKLEELFIELKKNKDNNQIATNIIKEINEKIENGELIFNNSHTNEIYTYMLLCNKFDALSFPYFPTPVCLQKFVKSCLRSE